MSLRHWFDYLVVLFICGLNHSWVACQESSDTSSLAFAESVADAKLIAIGKVPGTLRDLSGLNQQRSDGAAVDQFGGFSGIEWAGGNRYLVVPDRGFDIESDSYWCRFHEIDIDIDFANGTAEIVLHQSVLLTDERGNRYPGEGKWLSPSKNRAHRLDPEGIRLDVDGNIIICDEYGPYLLKFNRQGKLLTTLPVPANFEIQTPHAKGSQEDEENKQGRRSNRGLEGVAITPSGKFLVGLMQSPLIQDSGRDENGKFHGRNVRLLKLDLQTGQQQQFVYELEDDSHKLQELLAINENEFLVAEQDGDGGLKTKFKKLIRIDLSQATPLPEGTLLPPVGLPNAVIAVEKSVYLDLLSDEFGLANETMPDKIEGLSWGPWLDDNRRVLVVASDNDFSLENPTYLFLFSVSAAKVTTD
ncbi:MAG TPA: esterase-like activity of phytase family protein [Pirellulaceae bacterium]|nr:esterase-like activity of phytase family protein [Pirellulaceae bacterium]HMO94234.1 esterase-like activity of phytase family protein [Pirellulaceae bacterium]